MKDTHESPKTSVKFLIDSGQVQGEVLEYVQELEQRLREAEDILQQLDQRIADAVETLKGN